MPIVADGLYGSRVPALVALERDVSELLVGWHSALSMMGCSICSLMPLEWHLYESDVVD